MGSAERSQRICENFTGHSGRGWGLDSLYILTFAAANNLHTYDVERNGTDYEHKWQHLAYQLGLPLLTVASRTRFVCNIWDQRIIESEGLASSQAGLTRESNYSNASILYR